MRVSAPRLEPSPHDTSRRRLAVDVSYDDGAVEAEEYWIDLPATARPALRSGNPWLVALFPLAATLNEPLEIEAPVDRELLENVREILRIWRRWYPYTAGLEVRCEAASPDHEGRASGVGACFSGGVDSFFTLLRSRDDVHPVRQVEIEHLVTIWGIDLPLDRPAAFAHVRSRCSAIAAEVGCGALDAATNLRETRWREVDWMQLGHGVALAAVAHALDEVIGTILIPSGAGYGDLRPWASHPLTDPLLSSSRLHVVHDGATAHRVDKVTFVAGSELALRELRVCFRSESGQNCGSCPKCIRTMLTLELLGALERASCFGDVTCVPIEKARRLHCRWSFDFRQASYVRDLARERGRTDVARALSAAMTASVRRNRILKLLAPARRTRTLAGLVQAADDLLLRDRVR